MRTRSRWLKFVALTIVLATVIPGYYWLCTPRDPLEKGLLAYNRGEWEEAVRVARARLKTDPLDAAAVRLLGRASVRLGRNDAALTAFGRLGSDAMTADDLYLLGLALKQNGNDSGAVQVWEQARAADPKHPETLSELARVYVAAGRLLAASEVCRQLATSPGWKTRAESLLGAIQLEMNDPEGAIALWEPALKQDATELESVSMVETLRKETARALLQAGRPAEARVHLQSLLNAFARSREGEAPSEPPQGLSPEGEAPTEPQHHPAQTEPRPPRLARSHLAENANAECYWLLSRAHLQEGALAEALTALKKAGSFREENPLLPDPSPFVGSLACAECHRATYQAQQGSRHARTFFRVSELATLELPSSTVIEPDQPQVSHTLRRKEGGSLEQETHAGDQVFRAVVEYAFGSGDRGLTLVGRDDLGKERELRLSLYRDDTHSIWDVTSGHPVHPVIAAENLGQPLSADAVRRCFVCHVTSARASLLNLTPNGSEHGIGCEKCHGPGKNHLLAVAAKFPDIAIGRPTLVSGAPIVRLCGQCHSPMGRTVSRDDPSSVRFQATTLTWSRCFTESSDALDCTTCHDPHRNASLDTHDYEVKCLSCHDGEVRSEQSSPPWQKPGSAGAKSGTLCPVNPKEGCVRCHMPAAKNVVPHSTFTDHFIRVHRD